MFGIFALALLLPAGPGQMAAAQVTSAAKPTDDRSVQDVWAEARRLYLAAEFPAAREHLERILAAQGERYDVWQAWVATYRPGMRLDQARQEMQTRLAKDPRNPRLLFAQAMATRYAGDLERAKELFQAAAKLDPTSETIPYEQKDCFPPKHPRYRQLLQEALHRRTDSLAVLETWIWHQLEVEKRSPAEVEAELRTRFEMEPDSIPANFALGIYFRFRRPHTKVHQAKALEHLQQVASRRPHDPAAWNALAWLYHSRGEHDKALYAVQQGQSAAWWWPVWFWRREQLAYAQHGAQAALEQSRRFIEFFPDHSDAWDIYGADLFDSGQRDEAIQAFQKAIQCDRLGNEPSPRWNLAWSYEQAGRFSQALSMYLETLDTDLEFHRDVERAAIRILGKLTVEDRQRLDAWFQKTEAAQPSAPRPVMFRGRLALAEERYADAVAAFDCVVKRFPAEAPQALTHWGKMLVTLKKYSEAQERFLEALRHDVTYSKAFDGALKGLFDSQRLAPHEADEAIEQLRQLAGQHPRQREPLIYLGDALEQLGDVRGDHQLYEQALVPRLKLCRLNDQLADADDQRQRQSYRKVADLYAGLGDFDEAYYFYAKKAGDESFQKAASLLSGSRLDRTPAQGPFPPATSRRSEADSPPQVDHAANSIPADEANHVNLQNANFHLKIDDMSLGATTNLQLTRYYNSRTVNQGYFGFGWSSRLETAFTARPDQKQVNIRKEGGYILEFQPPIDLRQRCVDEIVRRAQQRQRPIDADMRGQLLADVDLLMRKAKELGILPDRREQAGPIPESWSWFIKPGEHWSAEEGRLYVEDGKLVFFDGEDRTRYYWDAQGQLVEIAPAHGEPVALHYEDERLAKVSNLNGDRWIKFTHDDYGHVKQAISCDRRHAAYVYSSDGDCLASRDAHGRAHGFLYGRWKNMTAIRYPDGSSQRIQYHENKDWALALRSPQGRRVYRYEYFSIDSSRNEDGKTATYGTTVRSHWQGKPTSPLAVFFREFHHDAQSGLLGQSTRSRDTDWFTLTKDPFTDVFAGMVKDKHRWTIERDSRGLRLLTPDGSVVRYQYSDNQTRINAVETRDGRWQFADDGKETRITYGDKRKSIRIIKRDGFPSRIEAADWIIEPIRGEGQLIVDYRVMRQGRWTNVGRPVVQRLREAANRETAGEVKLWKLGQPIDWPEDKDNADLAFVLQRLQQLYEPLSHSMINEHALHCPNCFRQAMETGLRGYELQTFEQQFLPIQR